MREQRSIVESRPVGLVVGDRDAILRPGDPARPGQSRTVGGYWSARLSARVRFRARSGGGPAGANDLLHPFLELALEALLGGVEEAAVAEVIGQAIDVRDLGFEVMGILIALAVAKCFHQSGGGIAQM